MGMTLTHSEQRQAEYRWVVNPAWDLVMAFSWIPFVVAALAWSGDTSRIEWLVAATLIFSVSHQPLTMPLVYADGHVYRSRHLIFAITPFVFLAAVIIGLQLDPVIIAAIAGVWNAGHTLQQRYGIARIYGRKVGQTNGRIEHNLLWGMLLLAVVWGAADSATPDRIARAGLGGRNQKGLELLTNAAPAARLVLPLVILGVFALAVMWVRQELESPRINPAKWIYMGSSAVLFGLIIVSPIAGFVGYVGAHAAEYYLIVYKHLGDRYPDAETDGGAPLGRAVRSGFGPLGLMVIYTITVFTAVFVLRWYASWQAYAMVFLTLGALHLFYDGLIWKLRRPEVARSFKIPTP